MNQNIFDELRKYTSNVKKVELTDDIKHKLSNFSNIASELTRYIDVYTFIYNSDGINVAGFLAVPKKYDYKLPVIIFNRGGTGDFGLVTHGLLLTRIAKLAKQGYLVIGSQYPGNMLSEGHDERGGVSDIKSVLNLHLIIINLPFADSNNIGMYGESRGGMMTYICMARVNWIKTVLIVGGQTNLDRSAIDRPEMNEVYKKHFKNNQQNRDKRSVVKWVDKLNKSTSLCLIHGSSDKRVNVLESLELAEKLSEINYPYSLHILNGGDHMLNNLQNERDDIIVKWLEKYLV